MQWVDFPSDPIQVCGLPWFKETSPRLWRLPERLKDAVRPELWTASQWPSGARLRFSTDAATLGMRARYPVVAPRANMQRFGQMGIDLYVDNEYCATAEELESVYGAFIDTLREARPDTPVVCITPIHAAAETFDEKAAQRLAAMRKVIRRAVSSRSEAGDSRLHLVEGTRLLGREDADGLTDGVHPNDLGYGRIAERLSAALLEALRGTV